jgi:pimeloyl-ACP methyl ester carboxylesterase
MPDRALLGLLLGVAVLPGCTTLRLALDFAEQADQVRVHARIDGRIETEGPAEGPLVVVLAKGGPGEGEPLVGVDTFVRSRPGSFAFSVAPGRYRLGAYEDRNANGRLDPGERMRAVSAGTVLEASPGGAVREDILLARDATTPPELTEPLDVLGIVARTPREQLGFSLWAWSAQGEICEDLQDPRFGRAAGTRGLWRVMDFVNDGLAGVYFLAPYDPRRVPVLFVHGIGGNPQDFTSLIDALDTDRFQPWFYFYPSGFDLGGLSSHLAALLDRLRVEHGFDQLAIVAHSMGGLVSRGAILKYAHESGRDDVRLFVSISTPWGGQPQAARATDAPIELPHSFADMSPDSEYLRALFHAEAGAERSLPPSAEFHMLLGFRMGRSSKVANDGTVTVASQARLEPQAEARSLRAFDLGHVEILESPLTLERVNGLLAERFE